MPLDFSDVHYEVSVQKTQDYNDVELLFTSLDGCYSTFDLPQVKEILNFYCPEVLNTKCFNPNNYTFEQEVENTPIAHLFEHILIQNIHEIQRTGPVTDAAISAKTKWNWNKESVGVFHIIIKNCFLSDELFTKALDRTISIFDTIYLIKERQAATYHLSSSISV